MVARRQTGLQAANLHFHPDALIFRRRADSRPDLRFNGQTPQSHEIQRRLTTKARPEHLGMFASFLKPRVLRFIVSLDVRKFFIQGIDAVHAVQLGTETLLCGPKADLALVVRQ